MITVRITYLAMGKISYEDKMRIRTFQKIGFGQRKNCYKFSWKGL